MKLTEEKGFITYMAYKPFGEKSEHPEKAAGRNHA